jgi:hypothetical protein
MDAHIGIDWDEAAAAFDRDGVVFLPQVLGEADLAAALKAWEWSLAHPALGGKVAQADTASTFYQDLYNPKVLDGYSGMLAASPIPAMCTRLWGTPEVWFMYEQVFLKEGGETRRTPWHQDASYLPIGGRDTAVAWITFDSVSADDALEFVPGSHRGTLYNASRFDVGDDTAPLFPESAAPRLPDIEAERGAWPIVSWPVTPGDLIVFDVSTLHGGAATHGEKRRRTLTLRFFGERAVYAPKHGRTGLPNVPGIGERLAPGDPFRDERFVKLWPKPA